MNYNASQLDRINRAWEELDPQFELYKARDWADNPNGWYIRCKVCESTIGFIHRGSGLTGFQKLRDYHSNRVHLMILRFIPHLRTQDHQQNATLTRLAG